VLSVEDWAEIRRLHRAEAMPIKAVARVMGCSKNTVKAALAADGPPRYARAPVGSIVDEVEPRIRELFAAVPTMPATVIAERIGWTRGLTVLKERVRELRPVYLPPDPSGRTQYAAGEIAQHDFWFPDIELPVGFGQTRAAAQLPVLTMVCGYSRWLSAALIPTRAAEDLFAGWWGHLARLGAVPRVLVWDGEGAVGRRRGGRSELTEACQGFRGTLAAKVVILKPRDPEAKGLLERAHDYLERSFLPGAVGVSRQPCKPRVDQDRRSVIFTRVGARNSAHPMRPADTRGSVHQAGRVVGRFGSPSWCGGGVAVGERLDRETGAAGDRCNGARTGEARMRHAAGW
jgi:transposase